jgi:hypothetical protein
MIEFDLTNMNLYFLYIKRDVDIKQMYYQLKRQKGPCLFMELR